MGMYNCTYYIPIIYIQVRLLWVFLLHLSGRWDKTADKIYEAFSWAKYVILQKMELGWTKLFEGYETNQMAKWISNWPLNKMKKVLLV